MHEVCRCFVVFFFFLVGSRFYPYIFDLLHWYGDDLLRATVQVKQLKSIWLTHLPLGKIANISQTKWKPWTCRTGYMICDIILAQMPVPRQDISHIIYITHHCFTLFPWSRPYSSKRNRDFVTHICAARELRAVSITYICDPRPRLANWSELISFRIAS